MKSFCTFQNDTKVTFSANTLNDLHAKQAFIICFSQNLFLDLNCLLLVGNFEIFNKFYLLV